MIKTKKRVVKMRAFEDRIVYNGPQVVSYDGAIAGSAS
jgi:hypothetical protein